MVLSDAAFHAYHYRLRAVGRDPESAAAAAGAPIILQIGHHLIKMPKQTSEGEKVWPLRGSQDND